MRVSRAGVVAGGGGDVVDLGELVVGDGSAGGVESAGFGDFEGWVGAGGEDSVVFGVAVDAAECCDEVFGGGAAAAGVAADGEGRLDGLREVIDLAGGGFVESA